MKNLIITFVIFLSAIAYGQRDSTIYEIQGKATLADTDVLIVSGSDTVYYKITYAQLKTLLNAIYLVDADSTAQTVWTDLKLAGKLALADSTAQTVFTDLKLAEKLAISDTTALTVFTDLKLAEKLAISDTTALTVFTDLKLAEKLAITDTTNLTTFTDLKLAEKLDISDTTNQTTFTDLKIAEKLAIGDTSALTVFTDLKLAEKAPLASPTFTGQVTTAGIKTNTAVLGESHTLGADSCYGMVLYIGGAYTITLPAIAAGMSVTFITIGANAVVIEPGSGEQMYLDGTLLDANDSATNLSTAGDMIVFTYYGAGDWYAASNGWTDND